MSDRAFATSPPATESAVVNGKGARRLARGHPWIYRSDLATRPDAPAGAVIVRDERGRELGRALWSPQSEIALRMVDRDANASMDTSWWHARFARAVARRQSVAENANAYRLVHAEADGCPSLICDRYDRWIVVQLLSAGIERYREHIVNALVEVVQPLGILARYDV